MGDVTVRGTICGACVRHVTHALRGLRGVTPARRRSVRCHSNAIAEQAAYPSTAETAERAAVAVGGVRLLRPVTGL